MARSDGKRFDVIPAIDLRGGRVVRLRQGDFARETVSRRRPARRSRAFADAGAAWLHVVDLDGARAGEPTPARRRSAAIVARCRGRARSVEAAGGIRTREAVAAVLGAGAAPGRLRHGRDPEPRASSGDAVDRHGRGAGSPSPSTSATVRPSATAGLPGRRAGRPDDADRALCRRRRRVVRSHRDRPRRPPRRPGPGLLEGSSRLDRGDVIASGGIRSRSTITSRSGGSAAAGAIVGRALYDGSFDLAAAIASLDRPASARLIDRATLPCPR